MRMHAAVFLLSVVASSAVIQDCQNRVRCRCGNTDKNITVCFSEDSIQDPCTLYSNCSKCQENVTGCQECGGGFEGLWCTKTAQLQRSRQKRQYRVIGRNRRPGIQRGSVIIGGCRDIDSPKLGSIRCRSSSTERTCVGTCLPGYTFEGMGYETPEIELRCENGVWSPLRSFPSCKSGGHCDLVVNGHGSFNCTTGMGGTRCDVRCMNRYVGQFYCYPGRPWEPPLPGCVSPKEVPEESRQPVCHCEYGASCDYDGHCVCPVGRTGIYCESIVYEKKSCRDPGHIADGHRHGIDGTESTNRRSFEDGESLIFGCKSPDDALQGSAYLVCNDGRWSGPLPKCIKPVPEVNCPDPGQVRNADRVNSNGQSSSSSQRFRVGESVVYNCRPGYALHRRSLLTCLSSGTWSDPLPYCTSIESTLPPVTRSPPTTLSSTYCFDPGVHINGNRQPASAPSQRGFPPGSFLEFSCLPNYILEGARTLFCLRSGRWSADIPTCKDQSGPPDVFEDCLNPGTFQNGNVVYYPNINSRRGTPDTLEQPAYPMGARLQYTCDNGYTLEGDSTLICLGNGAWSSEPPTCQRGIGRNPIKYCRTPSNIVNGRVQYTQPLSARSRPARDPEYPEGTQLLYVCNNGHTLQGPSSITCQASGQWSASPPLCTRGVQTQELMYCDIPANILDGKVEAVLPTNLPPSALNADRSLEYPEGTRLLYTCELDYTLIGSSEIICQSSGLWTSNPPVCSAECGVSYMQTTRRILHGTKTKDGEWPWVVAIAAQYNGVSQIICGGAVLNSRTAVTAAHCLVADQLTLYFGKLYRSISKDDSKVMVRQSERIIPHPDFTNSTFDSDIGLIMFSPPIRFTDRVQPICLPTPDSTAKNLMTGRQGYVTGWGLTEKTLPADDLLLATLPVLTNSVCMESYRRQDLNLPITKNMFCAGFEDGKQSACTGDSGSPLVFFDRVTDRHTLEGLVSFSVQGQCGLPGRYTVFTKVFAFSDWILRNLGI